MRRPPRLVTRTMGVTFTTVLWSYGVVCGPVFVCAREKLSGPSTPVLTEVNGSSSPTQ